MKIILNALSIKKEPKKAKIELGTDRILFTEKLGDGTRVHLDNDTSIDVKETIEEINYLQNKDSYITWYDIEQARENAKYMLEIHNRLF